MRRVGVAILIGLVGVLALAGCGEFQQRAAEMGERVERAEEAAVQNTGRLLELERRVSDLEAAFDALQTPSGVADDAP